MFARAQRHVLTASRPPLTPALTALVLSLLLGLQPLTTDLYLPALPMLTAALAAPLSDAQLTMSGVVLALGAGQLVWGPVADRFGRRPVLLLGLALYAAAALACVFAAGIDQLIAARAAQGAGLAAAVVVARAIVRDLYRPQQGAQVMALALSGLAVVAISGPAVGGLVASAAGWRAALSIVAACAVALLAFAAWRVPETARTLNPQATRLAPLLQSVWTIVRNRVFVAWALLSACSYGGIFTVLAGSSFVYIGMLGLSPGAYGLTLASPSCSYLAATLLCRRWIARYGTHGTVRRGAFFTLGASLVVTALALAGARSVWALLLPQWIDAFGHGMHHPCGQTGALEPFPHSAATAAALSGCLLAVVAWGVSRWLGSALRGDVLPYAPSFGFWAAMTALVAWTAVQRLPR